MDLPASLTVQPQGDANMYAIKAADRWLAIVQMNGEYWAPYHLEVLTAMAAVPDLILALERIVEATVDGGQVNAIAREALAKAGV